MEIYFRIQLKYLRFIITGTAMFLIMFINGLFDIKLTVTTVMLFLLVFLYKFRISSHRRLPGPFPWPLIGNCLSFGKKTHLKLHEWKNR